MEGQQKIAPCLWFDGNAEEAAEFYVSVFPNSRIIERVKSPSDWPSGKAEDVILMVFELDGQTYQALNGGPSAEFNDAVSLSVSCKDQAEVDRYWDALTADGGTPVQCGWLKDKYGLRWQIVPEIMPEMLRHPDRAKAKRAMEAMFGMVKIDVEAIKKAAAG